MELSAILTALGAMVSRFGEKLPYRLDHYTWEGHRKDQKTKASEIRVELHSFGFVLKTDMNKSDCTPSEKDYPVFFDKDTSEISFDKGKSYFKMNDFFNDEIKEITSTKVFREAGKPALSQTSRKLVKMWLD